MSTLSIGIIGTGIGNSIARRFATACGMVEGVRVNGICSRSQEKGEAFAREYGIPYVFTGEEDMFRSAQIDLVYIATPHTLHYGSALKAIRAGKAVLCEKPMCLTREETDSLFAEARRQNVFLMEGMWSRFLPNSLKAKEWVDSGRIGAVKFIDGMFSFETDPSNVKPRLIEPALGGGAMYDVGVYTIEMASFYAGCEPADWCGTTIPYCRDVDAATALCLKYPNDILATLRMGITCETPSCMTLYGTKGRIELPRFYSAPEARLYIQDALVETAAADCDLPRGFIWEIQAVKECMDKGLLQHPAMPQTTSSAAARIMSDMMKRFFQ